MPANDTLISLLNSVNQTCSCAPIRKCHAVGLLHPVGRRGTMTESNATTQVVRNVYLSPKQMVASLVFGVEALAKRVWSDAFVRAGPKADVGSVLGERLRFGDDREKRFASVAMMLYKTFRNRADHDFDDFECTWPGAMLCFSGVRQLLEWSEEMGKHPGRSG